MSADVQPVLFDVDTPPVVVPKRTRKASPKPIWTRYRVKVPVKCDDCMLVLALAHGEAPASRQAKWRRKQGAVDLLLCFAHATVRRDEDGLGALPEWKP